MSSKRNGTGHSGQTYGELITPNGDASNVDMAGTRARLTLPLNDGPSGSTPTRRVVKVCAKPTDWDDGDIDDSLRIPRTMEFRDAVSVVMGIVIGSGIFVSPAGVLKQTGSFGASLIIWAGCGFVATIGGLCYIELATMIQISGGDYAYIYHAFGPLVSFLYIWVVLVIILPSAIAVLAQTFSIYLIQSLSTTCFGVSNIDKTGATTFTSLACVFFLIAVNCYDSKWANRVQFIFTGAKMVALGAIVVVGLYNGLYDINNFVEVWSDSFKGSDHGMASYALAFYVGIFSYSGWNSVTYVTEEIKKPEKNMPRAIALAIPLITLFYIAVNVAYFSSLSYEELVTSPAVAVVSCSF